MKNRILVSLTLILSLVLSLSACVVDPPVTPPEEPEILITLGNLYKDIAEDYTLEITIESDMGHVVNETYVVKENSASIRVERINGFIIDENGIHAPDSYKTVTEQELTKAEKEAMGISLPNLQFSTNSLDKINSGKTKLRATITSSESFFGKDLGVDNIPLTVEFDSNSINVISFSYTTNDGSKVSVKYTFN